MFWPFIYLSTSSLEMPTTFTNSQPYSPTRLQSSVELDTGRFGFLIENSSGTGWSISLQSTYLLLLLIFYIIICYWKQDYLLCQRPSILLHDQDKRLTKISVWFTYGQACFFLLIHNSLYISQNFQSQKIQGLQCSKKIQNTSNIMKKHMQNWISCFMAGTRLMEVEVW